MKVHITIAKTLLRRLRAGEAQRSSVSSDRLQRLSGGRAHMNGGALRRVTDGANLARWSGPAWEDTSGSDAGIAFVQPSGARMIPTKEFLLHRAIAQSGPVCGRLAGQFHVILSCQL